LGLHFHKPLSLLNSFDAKRKEERRKENPSGDFFILTYIFLYLPFIKITWGISSILTAIRKGMFWRDILILHYVCRGKPGVRP